MADFPAVRMPPPPILTPYNLDSVGVLGNLGSTGWYLGSLSSSAWPGANYIQYVPFRLHDYAVAVQLLFWVGATSSGNVDVGIYDAENRLIVSSGSTAMSATTNTVQEFNITDTELPPGEYLLAAACSSSSATGFRTGPTDELILSSLPIYEQASTFPLPATAAPVVSTGALGQVYVFGIQFVSAF